MPKITGYKYLPEQPLKWPQLLPLHLRRSSIQPHQMLSPMTHRRISMFLEKTKYEMTSTQGMRVKPPLNVTVKESLTVVEVATVPKYSWAEPPRVQCPTYVTRERSWSSMVRVVIVGEMKVIYYKLVSNSMWRSDNGPVYGRAPIYAWQPNFSEWILEVLTPDVRVAS